MFTLWEGRKGGASPTPTKEAVRGLSFLANRFIVFAGAVFARLVSAAPLTKFL